jgi:hypothetical protein
LAEDALDLEYIRALLGEAEMSDIALDGDGLGYVLEQTLLRMGEHLPGKPPDLSLITHLDAVTGLIRSLPFEVDLWKLQNIYYGLLQTFYPDMRKKAGQGDEDARAWVDQFNALGDKLRVRRGKLNGQPADPRQHLPDSVQPAV